MSDVVAVAITVAIPPTLTALAAIILALRSTQARAMQSKRANGLADQLLKASAQAAHGQGVEQERLENRERHPAQTPPPGSPGPVNGDGGAGITLPPAV